MRKKETEVLIVRKIMNGKIIHQNVCTACISRTMPNPLRKKVQTLWLLVAMLTGIVCYLIAYHVIPNIK